MDISHKASHKALGGGVLHCMGEKLLHKHKATAIATISSKASVRMIVCYLDYS